MQVSAEMPMTRLPRIEAAPRRAALLALHHVPPKLRPLVRAYLLGYASAVAPRLLTLVLHYVLKRKQKDVTPQQRHRYFLESLRRVVCGGLEWQRFPTFCAVLVGGSTLLEEPLRRLFDRNSTWISEITRTRLSRWVSTFIAAWVGIRLLQSKKSDAFTDTVPVKSDNALGVKQKEVRYAGRTLDLSLFAFTRAVDVVVGELWSRRRTRRVLGQQWTQLETLVAQSTDPWIFTVSCALIMWTWIYTPTRLPKAYDKWISTAAAVDGRLIEALRRCRKGDLLYGQDTGQAPLLQAMCEDYKWPLQWGDPAKSIPFPCEVVHMGCGPSCEFHFLSRFYRSWWWSMATYLPLNLAVQLRNPSLKGIARGTVAASRSSAFLGAFISLFFYGVCLARTRIGPHLIGKDAAARQKIDGGICVGTGCFLCGWSVLVENAGRRKDMALFVAPRALATLFPRRYAMDKQWRETIVFAASTAVVFTCVLENQRRVRGVLGTVLGTVLKP